MFLLFEIIFWSAGVEGLLSWKNPRGCPLKSRIIISCYINSFINSHYSIKFYYYCMKSEIKICDSHMLPFFVLLNFLPIFMQKFLRLWFVRSTKTNIALSCAPPPRRAKYARLFDCGPPNESLWLHAGSSWFLDTLPLFLSGPRLAPNWPICPPTLSEGQFHLAAVIIILDLVIHLLPYGLA